MIKKLIVISGLISSLLIIIALPTLAQTLKSKSVDLVCMQTAIEKRDNAVITAWDSLQSSIKTVLETRKAALKTAWSTADATQRRSAIKAAWNQFKSSQKTARTTFKQAQKAAWAQLKTEAKACKATSTNEIQGDDVQF